MNQPAPSQPLASTSHLPSTHASQPPSPPPSDPFSSPDSEASKASSDSSSFNKLLNYSRSIRLSSGGSQGGWDYATGQYHVPIKSAQRFSGVERAEIDPNAPTNPQHHPTSITISQDRSDKEFELSGDEGGNGAKGAGSSQLFTETGRPRRSRQAMTRG